MEKKTSSESRYPVLVSVSKSDVAAVRSILEAGFAEAEVCSDIPELCGRISDQTEAVVVGADRLSGIATPLLTDRLEAQPEWSDLPIIVAVPGGAGAPVAGDAVKDLGNVVVIDHPFTEVSLNNALRIAFRSRERQRWVRDLSSECEHTMRALNESRNELEQKVNERTSELAERATQLRRLTGELILSEQRERRRLARVLHDNLQQLLVSAKYRVGALGRVEDQTVRVAVQEIEDLLGQVIEVSRSLSSELSPPIVHESGLRTGMEWLASLMSAQSGLTVDLHFEDEVDRIDENTKVLIFESTRELLNNVVKHAQVQSADLRVRRTDGETVEVVVEDQGAGFDAEGTTPKGFGIFRMRERLQLIGGRIEIDSSPGKGARVAIIAPLGESARQRRQPTAAPGPEAAYPRSDKPLSSTIRILIVDDHAVMRQGLSTSLAQEPDIVIVGEAADGKMAVDKVRALHPDVVLMDLGMPRMSGVEATRLIHGEMPRVRIIGLSMFEEKERARAMYEAGAVAYLSKSCSVEALTTAIRRSVGAPELPMIRT